MATAILSAARLRELLHYCPETGVFRRNTATSGGPSGSLIGWMQLGYVHITIDRKNYLAHRLAWLYIYGRFPEKWLDHINRNRADNRISNLREVTVAENLQNIPVYSSNTSGHKGVDRKADGAWRARIRVNGRRIHLGCFHTLEDAANAYKVAQSKFHPCAPSPA